MKKVYIIHGFESSPQRNWFSWLQGKLKERSVESFIPALPNPNTPLPHEWRDFLAKSIDYVDEDSYFIGHSLGCLGVLQFLQSIECEKIGGYMLVSGFDEILESIPALKIFSDIALDYKKLISISPQRVVISARDDTITPTHMSENLAMRLRATFIQTASGNHFMQEDGFTSHPLVLHILNGMLDSRL